MSRVVFEISVSLDGCITGPNSGVGNGLGDGGERLHEWAVALASFERLHGREGGEGGPESDLLAETFGAAGAFVMGRRMFDQAIAVWGDEPPFHGPVFVVTHRDDEPLRRGGTTFHFVTDGVESAVEQARTAAGEKDVAIAGGADVIRQCLGAGLVDAAMLHVVPVVLGDGIRLFDGIEGAPFELRRTRLLEGDDAIHLGFEVQR